MCFSIAAEAREIKTADEAFRMGKQAFLNERYVQAEIYFRHAWQLQPKEAAAAVSLGELYYAQSRYTEARQMFEQAKRLNKNVSTKKFLDLVLHKMSVTATLLDQIELESKKQDAKVLGPLHTLAAKQMADGHMLMVLLAPHLDYLLKENPSNLVALRFLADGYFLSSDPARAFRYYKKLARRLPHDFDLAKRFADTAVNVGAYDEARLSYKRALREAVRMGKREEVHKLKKLIHALPVFSWQIDAMIRSEKYESAFRELRKCLARNPSHPWAVVQMGMIYEEIGRLRQAESLYKKALQWRPEDPAAHYALGRFYLLKRKKFEKALEEFKIFRILLDENLNFTLDVAAEKKLQAHLRDATRFIGYVYLEVLRQAKPAVAEFEKITKNGNVSAEDYYNLGIAYLRDKKKTSAYQTMRKAIDIDPKSEAAKRAEDVIESMRRVSREGFEVEV